MALASGTRLGPYEILDPLGAGGMGEVYRAKDTRLDRTVAVKVLPSHVASDVQLRQRFEREAKALSSLSHAHICSLFDIGQQETAQGPIDYLVMEHLEGESLAQRLTAGPLASDELLRYSTQIADALDKAHRRGVLHRDLKPANIMLTKGGAKLVDFGLAKAESPATTQGELTSSPTMSRSPLTAEGTILGTYQYMAPEQLEGKLADARSDIFSLGAVFHEMATGQKAFSGKSQASLIASIMHDVPPTISTLQPLSPPAYDRVVHACLAKDPEERLQTAHDVLLQLQWISEAGSQAGVPAPVAARRRSRERLAWAAFCVTLVAATALGVGFVRRAPKPAPIVRFQVPAPDGFTFIGSPSLSPDGRLLAFDGRAATGVTQVWIRALDALTPRALQGTEGASRPFWSPDSRFVGFVAGGKLKKVEVAGGPAQTLADLPSGSDGTWSAQDVILIDGRANDPILRLPAAGGAPKPEVKPDLEHGVASVGWPQFLPDGRHYLYLAGGAALADSQLMVRALDAPEGKSILKTASRVQYVAPGYLLFVREETLVVQRFDAKRFELQGEAVPLSEGLGVDAVGLAHFSASDTGVLSYRAGQTRNRQLTWVDRNGKELAAEGPVGEFGDFWFSPDAKRLVVDQGERTGASDLWIRDLARGVTSRFTFDPANDRFPVWSPDGRRIAFSSDRKGIFDLYVKDASGAGEEQEFFVSDETKIVTDWSRDGRFVLFYSLGKETNWDVWALPMEGEHKPLPLVRTRFAELRPVLSPDSRYFAYQSDESGRSEIYVLEFPTPKSKWQVSTEGGRQPYWSASGREIFYLTLDNTVMSVPVEAGANFSAGTPKALFQARLQPLNSRAQYRPSSDGQRFLLLSPLGREAITPTTVILNWPAGLRN